MQERTSALVPHSLFRGPGVSRSRLMTLAICCVALVRRNSRQDDSLAQVDMIIFARGECRPHNFSPQRCLDMHMLVWKGGSKRLVFPVPERH